MTALRTEMLEHTGDSVDDKTMAEVMFPTMDASCQAEIVAHRVKIGSGMSARQIDTNKC